MDAAVKRKHYFNQISFGWNVIFNIIMVAAVVLVVMPLALVIIVSFSSTQSITRVGYSFFPAEWSLQGYDYLFKLGTQLKDSYIVSIGYAVVGTAMSLVVMSLYAYVIAQHNFPARRFLTWMLFFTMLFGGGIVPNYILNVRYLKIANTFWIFLLPGLANAWSVIILRTFLKTAVPDSLIDSARIDGAGHFRIFGFIVLPLFKAGIATIGLFGFVQRWNDWFLALLYNDKPTLTPLQTMLYRLQNNINFLRDNAEIAATPDGLLLIKSLPTDNLRMACTVMVILPILLAYPFFQRYFVRGMLVGSIKE